MAPSTQCESRVRPPSEATAHVAAARCRTGPVGAAAGTLDRLGADAGTRSPAERSGERHPVRGRCTVDERPASRPRTGDVRDGTHDDEEHAT